MNGRNKLEHLSLASFYASLNVRGSFQNPDLIVQNLIGALIRYAPGLLANIRLGWKGLPGTNTVAYDKNS